MKPHCHARQWTTRDKLTYLIALTPFLVAFLGTLVLAATISVYWTMALIALYLLGNVFQAGCCVGCPYRGRYCPALFGIFLANLIAARIYRDREYEKRSFDRNAALAEIVVALIGILGSALLFTIHWALAVFFLALCGIHVVLFFRRICPRCGYNEICPGGRAALALGKKS